MTFAEFRAYVDGQNIYLWRDGQKAFNLLASHRADLASRVRGRVDLDPFYVDEVLPAFWEWVEANWERVEQPTLFELVAELRRHVGLFDGAMSKTPKAAWEEALSEVRRFREIATSGMCWKCEERHRAEALEESQRWEGRASGD